MKKKSLQSNVKNTNISFLVQILSIKTTKIEDRKKLGEFDFLSAKSFVKNKKKNKCVIPSIGKKDSEFVF